jgi:hypothetical protein
MAAYTNNNILGKMYLQFIRFSPVSRESLLEEWTVERARTHKEWQYKIKISLVIEQENNLKIILIKSRSCLLIF